MKGAVVDSVPFRWDLVAPDQLGTLLAGTASPDLWFLDGLVACTGKVLARSGNGDLVFVGRSLDSMFDLLGGAFTDVSTAPGLDRLPLSFERPYIRVDGKWHKEPLAPAEHAQARAFLAGIGITPRALARRRRPVTLVDVVDYGSTFTELFGLIRSWIDDENESWRVIRRKLRFVGITIRRHTNPNTYRWHQWKAWTRELPARSVLNVSLDHDVWSYLGDYQVKLTRQLQPRQWLAEAPAPDRDARTRQAIAEAVAIVSYGRQAVGRRAIAHAVRGEPALAEPWLRTLVTALNSG